MIDSCKLRKLDPGFEAKYSKPKDLITSTMKSEPGRSVVSTSTREASSSAGAGTAAAGVELAATNGCAAIAPALAASVAIPPAAAPFRNLRRSTSDISGACSGFFMAYAPRIQFE